MNPPAPPAASTLGTAPSSLIRRLAALFYDLIAVLAIMMVVDMICTLATMDHLIQTGDHVATPWWYQMLEYLVVVAYFVVSWRRGGQTLGMRPWRMRLQMHDGRPIGWETALVRAGVVSVPLLALLLAGWAGLGPAALIMLALWVVSFGASVFDPHRRSLHDMLAHTDIVHATPPRRQRLHADRLNRRK